jgi:hypothetical protein
MIWESYTPYKDASFDMGSIAEVYLNPEKTLIKRHYTHGGVTSSGKQSSFPHDYVEEKWLNEVYYLTKFQLMPWVPELVSIDHKSRSIVQRYYGPDLLLSGFNDIPDFENQVVDICSYFKEIGVYKLNCSLSNMTKRNGQVIMFDFKYMRPRTPELKKYAEYEIDEWLSKISPTIVPKLKELI